MTLPKQEALRRPDDAITRSVKSPNRASLTGSSKRLPANEELKSSAKSSWKPSPFASEVLSQFRGDTRQRRNLLIHQSLRDKRRWKSWKNNWLHFPETAVKPSIPFKSASSTPLPILSPSRIPSMKFMPRAEAIHTITASSFVHPLILWMTVTLRWLLLTN